MRRLRSIRVWASIGLLTLAAGMPYCAAALGWAAIQDETSITVRADVAVGVVISWIGWAILVVVGAVRLWKSVRRRQAVRA